MRQKCTQHMPAPPTPARPPPPGSLAVPCTVPEPLPGTPGSNTDCF